MEQAAIVGVGMTAIEKDKIRDGFADMAWEAVNLALDDAGMIADLWDDEQPNDKLGSIWVGFALAQRIDAPWMEKGYRWVLDQGGEIAEQVTRFLLPKMMSRHRHDDLAALVYMTAREFEASPELDRALLRIAQYHFRTSRDDELSDRVRDAVADVKVEEGLENRNHS